MRRASYESSAGALAALLNGANNTQLAMVDLFTFTTPGGLTLRYTGADQSITINGITWSAGPLIQRSRTKLSVGIEVDTLDITLNADTSVTVSGTPIMQFLAKGGFDGARLMLERAFAAAPGSAIVGLLPLFSGRVSSIGGLTRLEARLTITSDAELLDVKLPRNIYQAACLNTLYDSSCGLARASFTSTATCNDSAATRSQFTVAGLAQAAGFFDLGVVTFTSGANNGISRTVRTYTTGLVKTIAPFPAAPANGDTFTVSAGCDKLQSSCSAKFSNIARFRGTPYIPTPESVT